MAIPEALRKQVEAVDEFVRQAPPIKPAEPVLTLKSDPIDFVDDEGNESELPTDSAVRTQPEPQAKVSQRTEDEWNRLTGKVSALQREINGKDETIAKLTQELVSLRSRPAQPAAPPAPGKEMSIDMPAETNDVFGTEGASILQTVATNAARAAVESMQPQVARTAADLYEAAVLAAVPDIDEINATPAFQEWLATPDSLTGIKPADLFERAGQALDSSQCIRLYKHFKDRVAPPPARAPDQKPSATKPPLDQRVSPGAKPTEGPSGQSKPTYTLAQYRDAQNRLTSQRGRLTPSQYRELRSTFEDMQRAVKENRIVG